MKNFESTEREKIFYCVKINSVQIQENTDQTMLRIWTLFTQFSLPTNWWQRSAIQIDKDNKNKKFAEAQVLETEKSLYFKQLWTFGFDEN